MESADRQLLDQISAKIARLTQLPQLKNVCTAEQFAAEILCGNRSVEWVQDQCRARKIKTVARKPWIIPMSEAARFINPPK